MLLGACVLACAPLSEKPGEEPVAGPRDEARDITSGTLRLLFSEDEFLASWNRELPL